jgi:hypothetical protein
MRLFLLIDEGIWTNIQNITRNPPYFFEEFPKERKRIPERK